MLHLLTYAGPSIANLLLSPVQKRGYLYTTDAHRQCRPLLMRDGPKSHMALNEFPFLTVALMSFILYRIFPHHF